MNNIRKKLLLLFLLMLPWQTRWIFGDVNVMGDISEFGRMAVYAFDIVLVLFLLVSTHLFSRATFERVKRSKVRLVALGALSGLVLYSFVTSLWAVQPMVALVFSVHMLLGALLFYVLLVDEEISIDMVLASIAVGMLVPSLLGWMQSATQSIDASTILGMSAQTPDTLGVAVIEHADGRWLRAYGSFPHPNIFGGFLAFGLISVAAISARGRMKRKELLLLLTAASLGGALIMSASRGAWLALVIGLAIFHFGHRMNKHKEQMKRASGPIFAMATTIVLIALFMSPVLGSRFDGENRLEERSISERTMQVDEAKTLLTRSPILFLTGSGVANYTFTLQGIKPLQKVFMYQPVHNVLALILVELGLLGFALFVTFVVATDWEVHKKWQNSNSLIAMSLGAVILVVAMTDHYLWTQVSGIYLVAIFFAVNMRLGEEA